MTQDESRKLIKLLTQVQDVTELRTLVNRYIGDCDSAFFAELGAVAEEYRARNDILSAEKLMALGDFMGRLRFLI